MLRDPDTSSHNIAPESAHTERSIIESLDAKAPNSKGAMAPTGRIERAKSKLKSTYAKFRSKAFVVRCASSMSTAGSAGSALACFAGTSAPPCA